ncbi:hypothetical protein [Sphingopyxis sp. H050]|uniref:hypothetical protein n=1 Tax=Sphingopyxis sp. H050 TaxID=1759072 RepID=UPI000736BD0E|nr:hypothetical protein [Sphingopyxis sp. H050]
MAAHRATRLSIACGEARPWQPRDLFASSRETNIAAPTTSAVFLGIESASMPAAWAAAQFAFKILTESLRFADWHGF